MILPPRVGISRRRIAGPGGHSEEPSLGACVLGTSAFLILAAICLYALAQLGS